MKLSLRLFLILFTLTFTQPTFAVQQELKMESVSEDNQFPVDKIAFLSGVTGLVLLFTPYVSFVGLILCLVAVILGILSRKTSRRKIWRRLAIITGSLGLVLLLGIVGLIAFF